MICTRKRTPRSTRKKCNGSVMMIKSRGKLIFQCTKCLGCMQPTELEDPHQADETEPYVNHSTEELKICYVSLLQDLGYTKYKRVLNSLGLEHVAERTYYRQAKNIYVLQEESFEEFQKHAIKEVERLYTLKGLTRDEDGFLSLTVSCDGSYPKRGIRAKSLMCATFIFECVTGIALDVEVLRRCNKCSNREKLGTECHAKTKLWHGKATDLECYTAKILFERSKNLKLKYSTIVCDGDSSSWTHVKDTYGPNTVSKEECIPHFQKRCWKHYDDACHLFSAKSLTKAGKNKEKLSIERKK